MSTSNPNATPHPELRPAPALAEAMLLDQEPAIAEQAIDHASVRRHLEHIHAELLRELGDAPFSRRP